MHASDRRHHVMFPQTQGAMTHRWQVGLGLGECIASGLRKIDGPQARPRGFGGLQFVEVGFRGASSPVLCSNTLVWEY